ncbi:fumarylacetoacetate hydrolase family protein [Sphingobium phenoxybenzoativorans]|uniref:Fumarylacetoacetate hydrolase family protein n=1 Tax=Sphingobium phenoxybenzoativorans TaxID=1592790 RepID=A0A975K4L4_9SPHN|nr:fumarylacetoacetate hydrolase family protein [Sphingobium phenoxybenzoativorans]QUT04741.1 fumarylacetoacetate hydrolase family protein [Sphingobium phenoxybenzoativorans]
MDLPEVAAPAIAIAGSSEMFPVRRIFCVGRNYAEHAREMGSDPEREPPFFFTKPGDAVTPGGLLPYPSMTKDLHHEVELVVALGKGGGDIDPADANALIFGHAVGIDLTRRDLQAEAKKGGRPWDMAKGFDQSAPMGPLKAGAPPADAAIALTIDGALRQSGRIADMIWSVPEVIAILSTYVRLAPGDLIFTGTPAGVGPILPGETVVGMIDEVEPVEIRYGA